MEIVPDHYKLLSARLPAEELQTAFNIALVNAASADCGSVVSPDSLRAEFGESVATNLALAMRFSPAEAEMYRIVLADYLRFCRQYIAESGGDDDGFDWQVYRFLIAAIRKAYKRGKEEEPII